MISVLDFVVVMFVVEIEIFQMVVGVKKATVNAKAHRAYGLGELFGEVDVNRARFGTMKLIDGA